MAADDSLAALVDRADRGLYAAKAAGRDTVRVINADQVPTAKAAAEPVVHHDLA
jgi:predicted signal transduction protein with EAL and GGDEF domain